MVCESALWRGDIDRVSALLPELDGLAGQTVLVTGAAGLICSAVVDVFARYNETHARPIHIVAAGRHPSAMAERFFRHGQSEHIRFVRYDATDGCIPFDIRCDYIIHGAGNASPALIVKEPVETMLGNFLGLYALLRYAQQTRAKRLLYISSSEIYGKKSGDGPFRESEYGAVDVLEPRSSYPEGKRAAESLCACFSAEHGVPSVIVRPGHIYGPTARSGDARVSSAWAYAAARGEDIVMKSSGAQIRSYCYCLDCASAIVKVLANGQSMTAYNISNKRSVISIGRLAELMATAGGVRLVRAEASEEEQKRFNPMQNSSLDSTRLESIGWRGLFDAKTGIAHTVKILRADQT